MTTSAARRRRDPHQTLIAIVAPVNAQPWYIDNLLTARSAAARCLAPPNRATDTVPFLTSCALAGYVEEDAARIHHLAGGTPAGRAPAAALELSPAERRHVMRDEAVKTRILVVDDDQDIRTTLRFLLADEGYDVVEARDGQEALAYLLATPEAHIVLLDVNMPHLDGVGVLRTVVKEPLLAARNVFTLVTAYSDKLFSASILHILTRLSIPVVQKPFDLDDLLREVAHAHARLASRTQEDQGGEAPPGR